MNPFPIFLALAGILVVIPLRWQTCVKVVLYLVVIEGAIRKWLVPGAADLIYFGKDFIMLAAYAKFFFLPPELRPRLVKGSLLKFILILASIIPIFQIANPESGSIAVGLFGIRGYILYIPMMFLIPSLFKSKEELIVFIRRYLIFLLIPNVFLAFIQYASPATSFINKYATEDTDVATMGVSENIRATGTFPYITGFSTYLSVCVALLLPLLTYKQSFRNYFLNFGMLILTFGGLLTTGSRGPLFFSILLIVLYLIFNYNFWAKGYYKKLIPVLLIGMSLVPILFPTQFENIVKRTTENQDAGDRLGWVYKNITKNMNDVSIFGFGVGTCHPSSAKIRKLFKVKKPNPVSDILDMETGRVFLETGLLGFFLWYFMRLYLIYALWITYRRLNTQVLKDFALAAFMLHSVNLIGGLVYNVTFIVYYWFLAGFILLLPQLDLVERKILPHK